jgi:putative sterol carrier protein
MKIKITILFTLSLLFISYRSMTNVTGPPAGNTNAPGNTTCGQSNCHNSTPVTSGTDWNNISLVVTTPGASLSTLQPNTTYDFSLTVTHSSRIKFGFQLMALPTSANTTTASIGTFTNISGTQIVTSGTRSYLEHTGATAGTTTKTWTFKWKTPLSPSSATAATFYVAINATNNNASADAGDIIYTKTFSATVLPVSWLYAKASKNNDNVRINWATATEENNWKFIIEKSFDKKEWLAIGEVKGKGNSLVVNKYSFAETGAKDVAFYRVKQVDYNGRYSYSDLMATQNEKAMNGPMVVFNIDKMTYTIKGDQLKNIKILSIKGEVEYSSSNLADEHEIPALPQGLYIVEINTETERFYQKILMN